MINKDTVISELPERYRLITYCYNCEQTNTLNLSQHSNDTIEGVSQKIHCPTCHSDNMGIRPVIQYRRLNLLGSVFNAFKNYWRKSKATA